MRAKEGDTDGDAAFCQELSLPCEPGMNPGINELKIKQGAVGGKKCKTIGQTTSGDESALKAAADGQTGELKLLLQGRTSIRRRCCKISECGADMMGGGNLSYMTLEKNGTGRSGKRNKDERSKERKHLQHLI